MYKQECCPTKENIPEVTKWEAKMQLERCLDVGVDDMPQASIIMSPLHNLICTKSRTDGRRTDEFMDKRPEG